VKVAQLQKEIEALRAGARSSAGELRNELESQLDLIVSQELRAKEESIIENGANSLMSWFCQLPQDQLAWEGATSTGVLSTAQNAVTLAEQPCIGVASADDKPMAGRVYYSDNRNQARRVAL